MKRAAAVAVAGLFVLVGLAHAQERIALAEAKVLLKKAIAFYKTNGQEKALAAFNDRRGQFVDRELYILVVDMNGRILAHGAKPEWSGKDLSAVRDVHDKNFIRDILAVAKTKGAGNVQYRWENPYTLAVDQKSSYVENVDGVILGCGYYN